MHLKKFDSELVKNIPAELIQLPQWVVWKYETPKDRDKPTKVPYQTNDSNADSSAPATWNSYEAVCAKASTDSSYNGIGFVFSQADPYTGIDLDDSLTAEGTLKPWANEIVATLNSYTEVSPSETGCKIWIKGHLPKREGYKTTGRRGKWLDGEVEMYDSGRYFAMTGKHIAGTPSLIREALPELKVIYGQVFAADITPTKPAKQPKPKPDKEVSSTTVSPIATPVEGWDGIGVLTDEEVIAKARQSKNGQTFRDLWEGRTGRYGDDDSRADMALCSLLAFWCQKNTGQIDRLYRRSNLMREKWNRDDYRESTIRKACELTSEVYGGSTGSAIDPDSVPDCFPQTDLGNARRLVFYHGDDIRYVPSIGWHVWTGTHWQYDNTGQAMRFAKMTAQNVHKECDSCRRKNERDRELLKWAIASESSAKLEAMLQVASTEAELVASPDSLNSNPWLFNCANGTIDLRTGVLGVHNRADMITHVSTVAFIPEATCPLFDSFMDQIFAGTKPLIDYVLSVLGHCMTGDISLEHMWVFYGEGANGKSTLMAVVNHILGRHAGVAPDSLLTTGRKEHPTELADLQGRRLVVASETESNARLKLQLVKRLTGEPTIKARKMNQDFYEFQRTHKLIMMTNNKPRVSEDSEAAWRRIKLVPFNVEIPRDKRDSHLSQKLRGEVSGILNRLLRGCLSWQANGLVEPVEVSEATAGYRNESDQLATFLEDRCLIARNAWVSSQALYSAYSHYAEANGDRPLTSKGFGDALAKRGLIAQKSRHIRGWAGISLNPGLGTMPVDNGADDDAEGWA